MYLPKHFQMKELNIPKFISLNSLATLISIINKDNQLQSIVNYVPLMYDQEQHCLLGHLANNNEQLNAMKDGQAITAIFNGADAYISPNWYQDKTQVPTWNFSKVEVRGRAHLIENAQEKLTLITQLSDLHEQRINSDWHISKLPEAKLQAMLGAITGFRITIEHWQGKEKLSQNKSMDERKGLINGLTALAEGKSLAVAESMKALG